ncbi:CsbA family protein [Bacillus sp. FJAT-49732]|uniref:CsbA family protein n=1 Tax=Lederbergia citrisecunda TaxID=2833583 RepID=A0A942TQP9_9BACI|nr:CsbA family protein [Lederbergia citrisecunda]MBS4200332.1 CsbA family protein [Lederbergia citrisecunda]
MIDKIISAIFIPALLMIFFTRVTYSRTVGFFLTIALIIVSAYKGYIMTWWLIVIEAASLTVGLYFTNQMKRKKKNSAST